MVAINIEGVVKGLTDTTFGCQNINTFFKSSPKYNTLLTPPQPPASSTAPTKYVQLDAKARAFRSQEPCYVREIQIFIANPKQSFGSISLKYLNTNGQIQELKGEPREKYVIFFIRDYLFQFEVGYSKRGARPNVTNIAIFGVSLARIGAHKASIAKFFEHAIILNKTLEDAQSQAESIQEAIVKKNDELDVSIQAIERLSKKLESTKLELIEEEKLRDTAKETIKTINSQIEKLKAEESQKSNNCTQLAAKENSLNEEVAKRALELSTIINDKSLISDEYRDYVREGKGQSIGYMAIITLSLAVGIFSLCLLYNGAKEILVHPFESASDVFASFLLRLPFAAVISGALYGSLRIAQFTFSKILAIHEERLTLAKLLIIAKETVYSTASSLGVTDEEKFRARIEVKLEMLKAYLANSIGDAKIKVSKTASTEKNVTPPQSSVSAEDEKKGSDTNLTGADDIPARKDPTI